MKVSDARQYVPQGAAHPALKPGDFVFSVAHLNHGHIYGMTQALLEAGGTLKYVYDPDPAKVAQFLKTFPQAIAAACEDVLLQDAETRLICGAHVTSERCALGLRVMAAGKDYFTDKAPMTTLAQLESARAMVRKTGRKYMVYYSERLHSESAILAGYMVAQGEIGQVLHVEGVGPHRLGAADRPAWFFRKENYGGILCDIGSHQIEQYLHFAGEEDAQIAGSRVANYGNPAYPELEDFGECNLIGANGTTGYFRVDWFTPRGLSTWGDGRTLILGTRGYIELRKYVNIASGTAGGDHVFLVNDRGEQYFHAHGVTGYPFFGQLMLDCLERTELAMTQTHAFKAAELCLKAQAQAQRIR